MGLFNVVTVNWENCTNKHCLLIEHTMFNHVAFVSFVTAGGRLRLIAVCTHGTVWCASEVKVHRCVCVMADDHCLGKHRPFVCSKVGQIPV